MTPTLTNLAPENAKFQTEIWMQKAFGAYGDFENFKIANFRGFEKSKILNLEKLRIVGVIFIFQKLAHLDFENSNIFNFWTKI